VTYFRNFGSPRYLGNGYSQNRQILHADSSPGVLTTKMQN